MLIYFSKNYIIMWYIKYSKLKLLKNKTEKHFLPTLSPINQFLYERRNLQSLLLHKFPNTSHLYMHINIHINVPFYIDLGIFKKLFFNSLLFILNRKSWNNFISLSIKYPYFTSTSLKFLTVHCMFFISLWSFSITNSSILNKFMQQVI